MAKKPHTFNKLVVEVGKKAYQVGIPNQELDGESAIVLGSAVEALLMQKHHLRFGYIVLVVDDEEYHIGRGGVIITEEVATQLAQEVTRKIGEVYSGKASIL